MPEPTLISTQAELDHALRASAETTLYVFKHSLTCPVSFSALEEYLGFVNSRPDEDRALYTYLEVQNARDTSNELASRTGVRHESPQVLVVRNGEAVWNASHWDISQEALETAIA